MKKELFDFIVKERKFEFTDRPSDGICLPRAYYVPMDLSSGKARKVSLNGDWDFVWISDMQNAEDLEAKEKIKVPSCWQIEGYDKHTYLNHKYPIPFQPPYVPMTMPVGIYSRNFHVDSVEHRWYLNFEGVDGFYYVVVNDLIVGYHSVAHSTGEFEITPYITFGENRLEVVVFKWSTATYFEDQDKLRMSGIFRDVYLLKRDKEHIRDFFVKQNVAEDLSFATIRVVFDDVILKTAVLYAPNGALIDKRAGGRDIEFSISAPRLWNAEKPQLYTLEIKCGNEHILQKIALRKVRIRNGIFYLNGQKIKLKGVNRHDSTILGGYVMTEDDILTDLKLMKAHNINAIRTSHYPACPRFYEFCDTYGFYVIDEADIETQGTIAAKGIYDNTMYSYFTDDPIYATIIKQRIRNLVERDKNFGCVLLWSLGNESGWGCNFIDSVKWIKDYDDSRIVTYESLYYNSKYWKDVDDLDIVNRMYASCATMTNYGRISKKPVFMCEYTHAMGNSNGDAADYQKIFEKYDNMMGGCVWEWNDHNALCEYEKYGKVPLYGGEFGEAYHDGNFCVDGLVDCYRRPKSGLKALKEIFCPLSASYDKGILRIRNKNYFTCSEEFADIILLKKYFDGHTEREVLPCSISPQMEYRTAVSVEGLEYLCVLFECNDKGGGGLLRKGEGLGRTQVYIRNIVRKNKKRKNDFIYDAREKVISNKNVLLCLDGANGAIVSLRYKGQELLKEPIELNMLRASLDNDMYMKHYWNTVGVTDSKTEVRSIEENENGVVLSLARVTRNRENIFHGTMTLGLSEDMLSIGCELFINKNIEFLPRLGLKMALRKEFDNVRYHGYGEEESYVDKHAHCIKDSFDFSISAHTCPYLKPQEYGSHWGCNWVEFSRDNAKIEVRSDREFSFNASPYSIKQLGEKKHNFELKKENCVYVCLDYKMSGVGSASCGQKLLKPYRMDAKKTKFAFHFSFSSPN